MEQLRAIFRNTYNWAVFLYLTSRYLVARRGLCSVIPYTAREGEIIPVARQLFRWRRRVRVVNAHLCPSAAPAVFVANHYKLDDPIYLWPAIHEASRNAIVARFMMRDDFFFGFPFKWWLVDFNDLTAMVGALLISREQLSITQIKPFVELLLNPGAFIMFPGRTRSRSGLYLEYREDIEDAASVAFFIAQAQRRDNSRQVPAVPMGRTWNPVTGESAVVFGEPMRLPPHASRHDVRRFDRELLLHMGELLEINAVHLVAGIAWLRCLHRRAPVMGLTCVVDAVSSVAQTLHEVGRHVDPALLNTPDDAVRAAVIWYERQGMMRLERDNRLTLSPIKILHAPALTVKYRLENPVKYHINQTLHMGDVTVLLEAAATLDVDGIASAANALHARRTARSMADVAGGR